MMEADLAEEEDDDAENDVNDLVEMLPTDHHGCFAHTIQLLVKDGFKVAKRVNNIISKCSKMVCYVRKSTVATEQLEEEKRIQAANETRWNSQLKMICSILAVPNSMLVELETPHKLTTHERNVLQELVNILIPLEEATDYAQTDRYPAAGYVLPCIKGLRVQVKKLSHTSTHHTAL